MKNELKALGTFHECAHEFLEELDGQLRVHLPPKDVNRLTDMLAEIFDNFGVEEIYPG